MTRCDDISGYHRENGRTYGQLSIAAELRLPHALDTAASQTPPHVQQQIHTNTIHSTGVGGWEWLAWLGLGSGWLWSWHSCQQGASEGGGGCTEYCTMITGRGLSARSGRERDSGWRETLGNEKQTLGLRTASKARSAWADDSPLIYTLYPQTAVHAPARHPCMHGRTPVSQPAT